jgi:benzoate/toluate 1,2-dioxygenase beta subunit
MIRETLERGVDVRAVERFLYREAMLLDLRRYEEWLDLFTEDGLYWVPAAPDQKDPYSHISLYFEDRILRQMRVRRIRHPQAFSLESPVRSSRLVGNALVERHDPSSGEIRVRSTFHLLELQYGEKHMYGGFYVHDLVPSGDGYSIKMKRVDLMDCDGPQETMQAFL